jgi:hypothetical protein
MSSWDTFVHKGDWKCIQNFSRNLRRNKSLGKPECKWVSKFFNWRSNRVLVKIHQSDQNMINLLNHYQRFARLNELPATTGNPSGGASVGVALNCLLLMQRGRYVTYTIYTVCTYKYIYVNVHTYIQKRGHNSASISNVKFVWSPVHFSSIL